MPSLRRARITLFLGLLLLLAAHAVPFQRIRIADVIDRTIYMWENWVGLWNALGMIFSGSISLLAPETLIPLVGSLLFIGTVLLLLVLPFVVALLHRARPFLWIARFILVSVLGFIVVAHILHRIQLGSPASRGINVHFLPGYWLLITSLFVYTLGLFFIPRLRPFAEK